MHASVYRTRERGIRLSRPKEPVVGILLVDEERHANQTMLVARLMNDSGSMDMLPALFKAHMRKISPDGVVITGKEALTRGRQKSKVELKPQTWWAFIHTESGLNRYDGHDPLGAFAYRMKIGGI